MSELLIINCFVAVHNEHIFFTTISIVVVHLLATLKIHVYHTVLTLQYSAMIETLE